ncbi:sperm-associated microtubule inner protein 5 [Discoglossus pictus]
MAAFRDINKKTNERYRNLQEMDDTATHLQPISSDREVLDAIEKYYTEHTPTILLAPKKSLTEPPISGWTGHIPLVKTSELGIGVRFQVASKRCMQSFCEAIKESEPEMGRTDE